jgi:hypothetical protein
VSGERQPARERYDAIVDLGPGKRGSSWGYALVKHTFRLRGEGWKLARPEALIHDIRDEEAEARITPDTDFWPIKPATDVVVQGSAFAPNGRPVRKRTVAVSVGRATKRAAVFGDRLIRWSSEGRVSFEPPEPFEEMPLDWRGAYGGCDFRVPVPNAERADVQMLLRVDHPGLYPRNPMGRGYFVEEGALDDAFLPNIEDPMDLLTPDRLITRDPKAWYRQPLPWNYDWTHPIMYPRCVFFGMGADAWYPVEDERELIEVQRGFLKPGFMRRERSNERSLNMDARFCCGASHGFSFPKLPFGTTIALEGMHPERETISLKVPPPPKVQLTFAGKRLATEVKLHHVVIRPAEETFTVVHGAQADLPRTMIPGIHKHIPLAVQVGKDDPLEYEAPPQMVEKLEKLQAEAAETARRDAQDEENSHE